MLFDKLDSTLMKQALIARLQFSLGYRLIAAAIKASKQQPIDFETKKPSEQAADALKESKKTFATFQDYCMANSYQVDDLKTIITSYVAGTGKQTKTTPDVLELRSKFFAKTKELSTEEATKLREKLMAEQAERVEELNAEFLDLTVYTNGFFRHEVAIGNHTQIEDYEEKFIDIEDIIPDSWVIEKYPLVANSQRNFWRKYPITPKIDAEIMMILLDEDLIATENKRRTFDKAA